MSSPNKAGTLIASAATAAQSTMTSSSRRERAGGRVRLPGQHELLPQPLGMLASELPRQLIEAAHAFDGDEERLVGSQASLGQIGDPAAEMVFQLLGIGVEKLPAAVHVGPPLGDLALQIVVAVDDHRPASHAGAGIGLIDCVLFQTPRSASTTVAHCRRCSTSSAQPWSVMR